MARDYATKLAKITGLKIKSILFMDEIKIDMSFIRGIINNTKNQAMVRSIIEFANECGMQTCIEGVEDKVLQDYLREYDATWFQGYYYSKPVAAKEIINMVSSNKTRE